jgi:hypothetical protein
MAAAPTKMIADMIMARPIVWLTIAVRAFFYIKKNYMF